MSSNRPQFINSAAVKSAEPEASDDKWSKVFTKSSNSKEVDSKVSQVRVDNVFSGLSISAQETESEKPIQAPKEKNAAVNPKTVAIDKKKEAEELKKKAAEEEKEKRRLENEQKEVIRLQMVENCTTILKTNLKGAALMEHIVSLQTKPFAHIFLYTVLQCQMDGNLKWLSASEFGPSLKFLGSSDSGNLVEFLREVEKYCGKYKFPKIEIKGNPRSLLEVIFQLLYKDEIVSDSHFLKWLDEDSDISGHTTAIVQTTNFMNLFRDDNDDGGDDDDDDEDEVDAPRQVIT